MSGESYTQQGSLGPYEFKRRISKSPSELGLTLFMKGHWLCPDLWELNNGNYAAIGRDITAEVSGCLPDGVAVSPGERVILIPGRLLASAKYNIPDET